MTSLTLDSPAKVNLLLAVHGPRGDGFHALSSVVSAVDFGDSLKITRSQGGGDRLKCDNARVPVDESNLILRASNAFRKATGCAEYFEFDLEKRIPMGAGLGGGSSNAATALRGMNELLGCPLGDPELHELAAGLGSDCPFFIHGVPAIMSGRGEHLEALPQVQAERLRGRRLVLFKPDFGIETATAYRALASQAPTSYESEVSARTRMEDFALSGALESLLFNSFESSVGRKYLAIPCFLELLRGAGFACLMSGSGSCCFALTESSADVSAIHAHGESAFGPEIFFVETSLR